mgnify:FL=1
MKKIAKLMFIIISIIFISTNVNAKETDNLTLYVFKGDGCPHCKAEMDYLDTIKDKYTNLEIKEYEVWYDDDNASLLTKVESYFNIKRSGVPTTIIGNTVIQGYQNESSTGKKIERAINFYEENDYKDIVKEIKDGTAIKNTKKTDKFQEEETKLDKETSVKAPIVGNVNLKDVSLQTSAVILGLIDGFNPCAMWILLFLISALIGMKDRKRMWTLGLTFLITSGLVYMLIMLSWISIAVKITTIVWIRNIIAIIALIGAILNLKSFIKSKNSGCEIVDSKKRKNIFSKIKKFTSEKSFILAFFGIIGLAISVNLVELACSAGLPLIFTELLAINNVSGFIKFIYISIYIIFFLIDDIIVFTISMYTMKATGISTKYGKYSHLIGGLIMLLIGLLLIIKPEWLMFQFN